MRFKIKSRIWIEVDEHVFLGGGRVRLLKAIEETGSLSKAARSLKISYKKAWILIDSVNKSANEPVIVSSVGGKNGGGMLLTPYGKKLISTFDDINHGCWNYLDTQLKKLENL
ncbi:MAG: winged helix-turn-helix domain-containing protein [Altibacter sp.]|uniref:winged helix-turn-helix domain-containing protein n=1 Tax=Altibacter sp. TaxID=2024823 RepID=UPI001D77B0B4|nr:winged helix-turn-helix domain-containing protein [Altibacter sp.]MBZ0327721.1 winged helix-turn-helix domain-containing protein [Altibacter sp.]